MTNAEGRIVGVRLRGRGRGKWAITSSHEGLFLPRSLMAEGLLLLVEGASDTAAALDLGLAAVGRPSAKCGHDCTRWLASLARGREAVVVADVDADGAGRRGAEALASELRLVTRSVRVIEPPPPAKDLRAWVVAGATRADVLARIEAAPVIPLCMRAASEVTR